MSHGRLFIGVPCFGGQAPTSEPRLTPRQQAAASAGISKGQAHQAQAVARFARSEPERFEGG